jgi:multicomponent Na+:H+ antiporter subunit G
MELVREILVGVLLVSGAVFAIIGGVGLIRLPDLFSRMHGAGVTDTLGAGLILSGLMLHSGVSLVTFKLAGVLFFLFVTSPTATHALARAALEDGLRPWTAQRGGASSKE